MSIWHDIDKAAFERNLTRLCSKQKIQDVSTLPELYGSNSSESPFSRNVEKDLAGSFAFLAATSDQPRSITASVTYQSDSHIYIAVAANEGITKATATALQGVIGCLKQQAARTISAREAEQACRRLILGAHRDRIFSRLGSSKAPAPTFATIDIRTRVQSMSRLLERRAIPSDVRLALQSLNTAISDAESSEAKSRLEDDALHRILQSSYDLMHGQRRLFDIIADRGSSREYRVLRALANYWRVCQLLVKCTSRHRQFFLQLDLEVLAATPARYSNGIRRYVHAEVQILIHLQEKPDARPQYIASSKKPCFLCYCLVRAHGAYGLSQSHGEVYEMWTVPHDGFSTNAAFLSINRALQIVVQDVQCALADGKHSQQPYWHPTQTVSKLLLDRLSSAPNSTAASASDRSAVEDLTSRLAAMSTGTTEPIIPEEPEIGPGVLRDPRTCSLARRDDYLLTDYIELFLDVEDQAVASTASLKLCMLPKDDDSSQLVRRVDIRKLGVGSTVTIPLPNLTAGLLLLEHNHGSTIIQLLWRQYSST